MHGGGSLMARWRAFVVGPAFRRDEMTVALRAEGLSAVASPGAHEDAPNDIAIEVTGSSPGQAEFEQTVDQVCGPIDFHRCGATTPKGRWHFR
jgi:hypothetical protein